MKRIVEQIHALGRIIECGTVTKRAVGRMPTASSTRRNGTPVHSAIADQPSSQVCFVIWVRAESALNPPAKSLPLPGRATRPSIDSRQSGEAPAAQAVVGRAVGGIEGRLVRIGRVGGTDGENR